MELSRTDDLLGVFTLNKTIHKYSYMYFRYLKCFCTRYWTPQKQYCIFFVFLAKGFSGVEKYVVGLRYNFALFFPLNWAVKLENFRLNLRMNSLVVPYWAQKRARVAKKRPILCNMTVWFSSGSFFKRISVFAYYFSAHSESREWWRWYFENWKKARLTEYKIRPWI